MSAKKIICDYATTGATVYCIARREADSYLLNDADGAFAAAPADPYVSLTENATIKGRYEKSEARTVWSDGLYSVVIYAQAGGSPSPAADTIIGSGEMTISADTEIGVYADTSLATAVWQRALEGAFTAEQVQRLMLSALTGKVSGAGTTSESFRDMADTKDRLVVTVDASGNRTGVVRDAA